MSDRSRQPQAPILGTQIHWLLAAVIGASLACNLTGSGGVPPEEIAAQVAGTLAALATPATTAPADLAAPATAAATHTPASPDDLAAPLAVDELTVVYVDGGSPWIYRPSSGTMQLSLTPDTYRVLISDDAALIVFLTQATIDGVPQPSAIHAVSTDGSGEQVLVSPAQLNALYPLGEFLRNDISSIDFIPGTHSLLLNTRAVPEGPGLAKYDDLLRLNGDSGDLTTLLPPEDGGDFSLAPDGSRVAIIRPDDLRLADPDGSDLTGALISYTPLITYSEYLFYIVPQWTPDSGQLGVVVPSPDILADTPTGTIYQLSADGNSVNEVATFDGDFFGVERSSSGLSPDLDKVVLRQPGPNPSDLLLASLPGGPPASYATDFSEWQGWAPGGNRFAFSSGAPLDIQLGEVGLAPVPLVNGNDLRWVSDDQFLFLSGSIGAWTLRLGTVGGGAMDIASPGGDFIAYDFVAP